LARHRSGNDAGARDDSGHGPAADSDRDRRRAREQWEQERAERERQRAERAAKERARRERETIEADLTRLTGRLSFQEVRRYVSEWSCGSLCVLACSHAYAKQQMHASTCMDGIHVCACRCCQAEQRPGTLVGRVAPEPRQPLRPPAPLSDRATFPPLPHDGTATLTPPAPTCTRLSKPLTSCCAASRCAARGRAYRCCCSRASSARTDPAMAPRRRSCHSSGRTPHPPERASSLCHPSPTAALGDRSRRDRLAQRAKHDDVGLYPAAAELSRRILDGLKHALVICGTR
jgi:hypothetical protein